MEDPVRDALQRFGEGDPLLDDGRVLLRAGLAIVLVWFGVDKFVHTSYWPMWVPDALAFMSSTAGLYLIGAFEVLLGLALLSGRRERAVSLATAAYLAAIVIAQGVAPVVRDIGLLAAALYLGLTAKADVEVSLGDVPTPSAKAKRAGLVVAVVAVLGVAGAAVGLAWIDTTPEADTGPLLAFQTPADGDQVAAGDVDVRVDLDPKVHDLGLDHVHVKVDGRVVDALYFDESDDHVRTTIHLEAGQRRIGAYLAYIDHIEYEDSWTEIEVVAE